jgi:hypothetical protein
LENEGICHTYFNGIIIYPNYKIYSFEVEKNAFLIAEITGMPNTPGLLLEMRPH